MYHLEHWKMLTIKYLCHLGILIFNYFLNALNYKKTAKTKCSEQIK